MGCVSSNFDVNNLDATFNAPYGAAPLRTKPFKRNFSSRVSAASSGISSGGSTPSKTRSIWSRSRGKTPETAVAPTLKPKPNDLIYQTLKKQKDALKPSELVSVCDDFREAKKAEPQQLEHSHGYFTDSMTIDLEISQPGLVHTQDTSESDVVSDLEMEMYMLKHSGRLMPKTSSPLCERRDTTYAVIDAAAPQPYTTWRKYLQETPAHLLHNVTNIPEAIAGQFCPLSFPAFSNLAEIEAVSAAKRYKMDVDDNEEDESVQPSAELLTTICKPRAAVCKVAAVISTEL